MNNEIKDVESITKKSVNEEDNSNNIQVDFANAAGALY